MTLLVNEVLSISVEVFDALLGAADTVPVRGTGASEENGAGVLLAENVVLRVLWTNPETNVAFVIDINKKETVPIRMEYRSLAEARDRGDAQTVQSDPRLRLPPDSMISPKSKARRKRAYEAIEVVISREPDIYFPDSRGTLLKAVAAAAQRPVKTIRRWVQSYWQRGLTPSALISDWDKCGTPKNPRKIKEKKLGRPRTITPGIGLNVTPAIERIFRVCIRHYYLKNAKASLRDAYTTMLRKCFPEYVEEDDRKKLRIKDPDRVPSYEQLQKWYQRRKDLKAETKARRGRRYWEKNLRELLSNSTVDSSGPGDRFQIDATVADVYLVSRDDPTKIIGRPVVYVVIDVWSRLIVGIDVGIENPSWTTAMMALANVATDKVAYCKKFGIDIVSAEWPAANISNKILGDRGEMEAFIVERHSALLHVDPENTAPYRADWKGIVESRFRILPAKFAPLTLGYIEPDFRERGGDDYRLDATLNIDDFTAVMIEAVLEHNAAWIDDYPIDPALVKAGVGSIPNDLWAWGIANRSGRLRSYPEDLVRFSLMPTAKATVTPHGIEFVGRHYTCDAALRRRWFSVARSKGTWPVTISFDPRCLDEVLLHDEADPRKYLVCILTPGSNWGRSLGLQEVNAILQERKRQRGAASIPSLERRMTKDRNIEEIVINAKKRKDAALASKPGAKTQSKASQVGAIRTNRAAERNVTEKERAFRFSHPDSSKEAEIIKMPLESVPAKGQQYPMPSVLDMMKDEE